MDRVDERMYYEVILIKKNSVVIIKPRDTTFEIKCAVENLNSRLESKIQE
jgi:hypothetical protein